MAGDKVLIIGKYGFIGSSLAEWLRRNAYAVTSVSARNEEWRTLDLSEYKTIINASGIAHRKEERKNRSIYYQVNRDQVLESAKKAKANGVSQYIYISSMNVYGSTGKRIGSNTPVEPDSLYGRSKRQGELKILQLEDDTFATAIIRPPVVYGTGCKGSIRFLVRASRYIKFFPAYPNRRSLIDIINLCKLIGCLIEERAGGIYHPQNKEYLSTYQLLSMMARFAGRKMIPVSFCNPLISWLIPKVRIIRKIFGDDCYDSKLSDYPGLFYQLRDYEESIQDMLLHRKK